MIAKKECTKTQCPLCERKCQAGSTNSGFIENNGACLVCLFGKTQAEICALLLAKKTNDDIKNAELLGVDLAKQPNENDKGVMVIVSIDKENCIENIDVVELNSAEIDNRCNCAACQHRKNTDENKFKSPAYFKGYEPNDEFISSYNEEVTIKKTWQKPDGSAWVTFLSNQRMGFLDMQLSNFAKRYKAKPKPVSAPAPTKAANWTTPMPINENDTPVSKSKVYFEGVRNNEVVGGTRASDERRFFYITFSYFIGGKRGHRKGFISHRTFNNEMFNINVVSKEIKKSLAARKIKTINVLIENWKEVNKSEYVQLMRIKK